jgi:hypothetical protein
LQRCSHRRLHGGGKDVDAAGYILRWPLQWARGVLLRMTHEQARLQLGVLALALRPGG